LERDPNRAGSASPIFNFHRARALVSASLQKLTGDGLKQENTFHTVRRLHSSQPSPANRLGNDNAINLEIVFHATAVAAIGPLNQRGTVTVHIQAVSYPEASEERLDLYRGKREQALLKRIQLVSFSSVL
jgi:hypothetical protein